MSPERLAQLEETVAALGHRTRRYAQGGVRKHKCQGPLWRCAVRGHHPKWVVYPFPAVWVLCAPLNGIRDTFPRDSYTRNDVMTIARAASRGQVTR